MWANKVLKDYLLKGFAVSQRFERIENEVHSLKSKVDEIDFQIHTKLPVKVYHLGASLKDLGKKWFAFSILNYRAQDIISKLNEHSNE